HRSFRSHGRTGERADRRCGVPERDVPHPPGLRCRDVQPAAVHALRPWRSLRRARGARSAGRRHPSVLRRGPVGTMSEHDLLIKGGTVVDGTGAPARTADVAITDGVVTAVGQVDGTAREVLDADGLLVTPGFVDVHTHFDGQITWDPLLTPTCWH